MAVGCVNCIIVGGAPDSTVSIVSRTHTFCQIMVGPHSKLSCHTF